MNCARFLVAERDAPDATFLVEGQTRFSYGDLARDVRHVARWLRDARLAQGDFCFLVSENAYRWAVFYLAVLSAGGVVVPLPPSSSARDVERIAKRLRPRFVFHRDRLAPLFATDAFAGSTVAAIDAIELDGSSATGGSFDALEWAAAATISRRSCSRREARASPKA